MQKTPEDTRARKPAPAPPRTRKPAPRAAHYEAHLDAGCAAFVLVIAFGYLLLCAAGYAARLGYLPS
jgi:hypothetical protein